ncbi:hypothetical protein A0H81_03972 [Grifola frondosa]|uniref:Uncharacterized protein n=1 Tax=Grifola frondosa TaxID=5627 RepID=A0A1C7MJH3_GRIFR|nr:hypothetical protein A0H81_03972 [Grifola frondosa]
MGPQLLYDLAELSVFVFSGPTGLSFVDVKCIFHLKEVLSVRSQDMLSLSRLGPSERALRTGFSTLQSDLVQDKCFALYMDLCEVCFGNGSEAGHVVAAA